MALGRKAGKEFIGILHTYMCRYMYIAYVGLCLFLGPLKPLSAVLPPDVFISHLDTFMFYFVLGFQASLYIVRKYVLENLYTGVERTRELNYLVVGT